MILDQINLMNKARTGIHFIIELLILLKIIYDIQIHVVYVIKKQG